MQNYFVVQIHQLNWFSSFKSMSLDKPFYWKTDAYDDTLHELVWLGLLVKASVPLHPLARHIRFTDFALSQCDIKLSADKTILEIKVPIE